MIVASQQMLPSMSENSLALIMNALLESSIIFMMNRNELLRAMELRLTALRGELETAWYQAAGTACSSEEITAILKFCHQFGAVDLR